MCTEWNKVIISTGHVASFPGFILRSSQAAANALCTSSLSRDADKSIRVFLSQSIPSQLPVYSTTAATSCLGYSFDMTVISLHSHLLIRFPLDFHIT